MTNTELPETPTFGLWYDFRNPAAVAAHRPASSTANPSTRRSGPNNSASAQSG